jgi:hypothetical protein
MGSDLGPGTHGREGAMGPLDRVFVAGALTNPQGSLPLTGALCTARHKYSLKRLAPLPGLPFWDRFFVPSPSGRGHRGLHRLVEAEFTARLGKAAEVGAARPLPGLMTASSLADRALQMVRWGLDRVRSGSPADHAINRRNMMGEVVLEGVDLLVDCMEHRLRPRPESPHRPLVKLQR